MFTRTFHPERFLRSVYGTASFRDYCQQRTIPFEQSPSAPLQAEDVQRWTAALEQLPRDGQAQVELELAKVNEMSGREVIAHLLEAAEGMELPSDLIPGGAPLALWFFLHHPGLFHEVFLHEEIREVDSWRHAQARAGVTLGDLGEKAAALAKGLREFFRLHEGAGRFCAVDAHPLGEAYCFVAHLADRLRILDIFTDAGARTTQRLRPAFQVLFAYYPQDGTVLLKSHLRARHRLLELFQHFGRTVLGVELEENCLGHAFHLDLLKQEFRPLPDAEDMVLVRVKALHFRYPERAGRRQVKLETLSSDEPSAIGQLLRTHLGGEGLLAEMQVTHAELQVRLLLEGRAKNYLIRLWPNRCNLNQTPLGERFRTCLQRWGLYHAG